MGIGPTGHRYRCHFCTHEVAESAKMVTRSSDAYAWTNHYNVKRPYKTNALDQCTKVNAAWPTYDARGNLASDNIGG